MNKILKLFRRDREVPASIADNQTSKRNFLTQLTSLFLGGVVIHSQTANANVIAHSNDADLLAAVIVKNINLNKYTTTQDDAGKILVFSSVTPITVCLDNLQEGAVGIFEQGDVGQVEFVSGNLQVRHVAELRHIAGKYGRVYYRVSKGEIIISGDMA